MKRLFGLLLVILASLPATVGQAGASPQEIMSQVAAHQDQALKLRESYVYQQHIRIVTRRTNGRLAREETTDYVVTPTAEGTKKELKSITGRYWHKGSYHDFQGEPRPESDSLDGDLIKDLRDDLANDQSRDGIGRNLFPRLPRNRRNINSSRRARRPCTVGGSTASAFAPGKKASSPGRAKP